MKKYVFVAMILMSVLSASCAVEKPIGGERDEHGCRGPAGYSWSEDAGACIREWELNENQKRAAGMAVKHIGYEKGTTIIRVDAAKCPGCFIVHLEKGKDRIHITIENWQVVNRTLTPEECTLKGGKAVNKVGDYNCDQDEINIGEVTGFISPHICCMRPPGE